MATAYAAVVSLINVLNRIQHPRYPVSAYISEIQALVHKVSFLVEFLEGYSGTESKEMVDLKIRITDAAYAVEDIFESYIVEQIRAESACGRDISQDLQKEIQEIDFITEEMMKIKEKIYEEDHIARLPASVSSFVLSSDENPTVGFKEDLVSLMDKLTGYQSSRQIIGVVGMGGIGKTTLARNVYDHPFVISHFHFRSWVTVSQNYSVEEMIWLLLRSIGLDGNQHTTEHLGDKLYKGLFGRKYLVVLDDMWSSVAWEKMRRFFPDNGNGSRILLTTRISNVALGVGTCSPYEMKLLNDDESWDMLSMKVFGQEACPTELEKLGKQIAKSCKGLPLAIVVVGGLLKTSDKARQYWEEVAENVMSIVALENDEHCSRILSLSYNNLPIHLKPCFLYMASFPEDFEISITRLVRLWVSDGFLKPIVDMTLEEVAIQYLNDLIDRSLIMVRRRREAGGMKSCVIHDLLWNLCLREAQIERFVHVLEDDSSKLLHSIEKGRRCVMSKNVITMDISPEVVPLSSFARSFVLHVRGSPRSISGCSLLRVFRTLAKYNPMEVLHLVNSRYLEFSAELFVSSKYFSSISLLWNLETLIVDGMTWADEVILPSGIWELRHLRHLIFNERVILSDPVAAHTELLLENLQTLSRVEDFSCSDEVVNRIPNLKKLSIYYDMNKVSQDVKLSHCFKNLVCCRKLETLKCFFTPKSDDHVGGMSYKCVFYGLETLSLSPSLRKLSLWGSNIPWECMTIVGSLPNLELLKLECNAFCGQQWNSVEGEFQKLKYLSIDSCDLATWEAESHHFPRLECLALRNMVNLEEISSCIGDIMALKSIRLFFCRTSAAISAMEILKDQQSLGNDDILIKVHASYHQYAELKSLMNVSPHFQITRTSY